MSRHDFDRLRQHYPLIIGRMDDVFTSHEFILCLAQYDQPAYVDALREYCDGGEPFKVVHQRLSSLLETFPELVAPCGREENSRDIFGNRNSCSRWQKHQAN